MNKRENLLRAVRFETPEYIPITCSISDACWEEYPQSALQDLMAEHPMLFPGFRKTEKEIIPDYLPRQRADKPSTDSWGCVWKTSHNGITGTVVDNPLADWNKFDQYRPPSPAEHDGWGPIDWKQIRKEMSAARRQSRLAQASLRHGHTFMTLMYLRGYENLVFDMHDRNPRLPELVNMVKEFNLGLVHRYVEAGAEWMAYPEDLGMQTGPMLSPEHFRQYIKPVYRNLIAPAREAGCVIHMHSDGDVRDLSNDLIDAGMEVLNIQDLVNGIEWVKQNLKNRVCIDLDIDRQSVTRFGTPGQIHDHIRTAVQELGSKRGGLTLVYGLYPGTPLENAGAVMEAMEKCSGYFS
ncbi:MAG: uroporphyrinogen decarboxylase family protein [Kiritimatiellia bacterium]